MTSVRTTIGIDAWAWTSPKGARRELLDAVEADPLSVLRGMHAINVELGAAGTAAFALVNGAYVAPLAHAWFARLDELARSDAWRARPRWAVVVGQTALDQTLGAVVVLSTMHVAVLLADQLAQLLCTRRALFTARSASSAA